MVRAWRSADVAACRAVSNPACCRISREISYFSPLNLGTLLRCCVRLQCWSTIKTTRAQCFMLMATLTHDTVACCARHTTHCVTHQFPVSMGRWQNVGLMLAHHLRRRPNASPGHFVIWSLNFKASNDNNIYSIIFSLTFYSVWNMNENLYLRSQHHKG